MKRRECAEDETSPSGHSGGAIAPKGRAGQEVGGRGPGEITGELRDGLVRLAYRFVWNRDDAEDIAQDAIAKSLVASGELREQGRWWAWLCRIVVHRCHEYGRRRKRWTRHEASYGRESVRDSAGDARPDERGEVLRAMLNELPARQREVMVLRHLQGMDYAEIGRVLEISPSTARVHAQSGREALRGLLLERHPGWFSEQGSGDAL
jgi:RNA polymerase sigma factor (sigma-70 family)